VSATKLDSVGLPQREIGDLEGDGERAWISGRAAQLDRLMGETTPGRRIWVPRSLGGQQREHVSPAPRVRLRERSECRLIEFGALIVDASERTVGVAGVRDGGSEQSIGIPEPASRRGGL
jgi:hypothetical protein